jgi:hypothetical protein
MALAQRAAGALRRMIATTAVAGAAISPDGRVPGGAHHRRAGGGEPGGGAGPGLPAAADRGADGAGRHAGNVGEHAADADPRQRLASSGLNGALVALVDRMVLVELDATEHARMWEDRRCEASALRRAHDWIRETRRAGGPRRRHHAGATAVPGRR